MGFEGFFGRNCRVSTLDVDIEDSGNDFCFVVVETVAGVVFDDMCLYFFCFKRFEIFNLKIITTIRTWFQERSPLEELT